MTGPAHPWHRTRGLWSALICLLFAWAAAQEVIHLHFWRDQRVLQWDIEAYYHYLPATFIHGDVRDLGYVADLDQRLHANIPAGYGIYHQPGTGHDCLKYTCGVALFEAPLFLLAHGYCLWSFTTYAADGYSPPYQLAAQLSSTLFTFLGLLVLRAFLLRHVRDRAAALALLTLALGTNLFFYSTVDGGMSHAYLFFLFAVVIERTDAWHRGPRPGKAAALGLALGTIALSRPIDIVVVLIPLLWTYGHRWRTKWALVRTHHMHVLLALAASILPLIPQLLYWKATTGQFVHYSYQGEGFNWNDPHIIDGLFSYRKGWLVWSPLVALGLAGLGVMLADASWRTRAWPVIAFFPPALYGIFSWHQWWYGGSFGSRPMVDTLPLLALPIAVLAQKLLTRHVLYAAPLAMLILAGVHLNLFQQRQYLSAIVRWDGMTCHRYWEVFGHENWDGLSPFP